MLNYLKAFILAIKAHKGQRDKAGKPYILHPIIVSLNVIGTDAKIVGMLHDVIEDSKYTLEDMPFLSLPQKEALMLLTKKENVNYEDYINKIAMNCIAKEVKMADLKHNSNLNRLRNISLNDIRRQEKYSKALSILTA